jgi:transcription initiation factor IIE alpha subunit
LGTYQENIDVACPNCGRKSLWVEAYEEGIRESLMFYCLTCDSDGSLRSHYTTEELRKRVQED